MVRHTKKQHRIKTGRLIFAALFLMFAIAAIVAAVNLIITQSGYAASKAEYAALREYAPTDNGTVSVPPQSAAPPASTEPEPLPGLSAINPDYIGWIRIADTAIDYPIARGEDNEKYLSTTFMGESNKSGAIFMDCRCTNGFDGFAILYGHNMKDGAMFADLNRYLEDGYLVGHQEITVATRDGEMLVYRVFAVRVTDMTDTAYTLPDKDTQAMENYMATPDAPENAERVLILSTCTSGGNDDERLLVFAAAE